MARYLTLYRSKYFYLEKEFRSLAEDLRPHMEQAMKIEVAPWIKDHVVDMDELYTELTLEQVEETLFGNQG